jgi:hypothetical protein
LLLVGVVHTSAVSLLRERIERWSRAAAASAFTAFVTPRAMTIYLWHMPVLLVMAGATAVFSMHTGLELPPLDSVGWWAARPMWLAVALALTALVAVFAARFERRPVPAFVGSSRRVATAVLAGLVGLLLLLVLGSSVATIAIAITLIAASLRLTHPARTVAAAA